MLCGSCCLISQTRGTRACIITSAAALALSSISGLLSRKITYPAEQWNTGSVLRARAFLLWMLWTSYRKDQEELLQDLKSCRNCLVKQWEYDLDSEREIWWHWDREMFNYISFPACYRRGFILVKGMDYLGWQAWGYIFEESFLPAGVFWCSIFFPWASLQLLHS